MHIAMIYYYCFATAVLNSLFTHNTNKFCDVSNKSHKMNETTSPVSVLLAVKHLKTRGYTVSSKERTGTHGEKNSREKWNCLY
jgi:hypothetical protein